jgi:hypothetical protein
MQSNIPTRELIPPVLLVFFTFTIIGMSLGADQYAYSQSSNASSAASTTATGVNLIDIHSSPVHLKSGSKFEIFSTVTNNSPSVISFIAGACDSPLSADFAIHCHLAPSFDASYMYGCISTEDKMRMQLLWLILRKILGNHPLLFHLPPSITMNPP